MGHGLEGCVTLVIFVTLVTIVHAGLEVLGRLSRDVSSTKPHPSRALQLRQYGSFCI